MKRRIVIADDDPIIVSLVTLRLGMARYEVLSAADGPSALPLIRQAEPLAVILDVRMPGRSGLSVLDEIKADPMLGKLPVMMLSGDRDSETIMTAVGSGAADYMVKPFDPDQLVERMNRLVRSSAMVWNYTNTAPAAPAPELWEL